MLVPTHPARRAIAILALMLATTAAFAARGPQPDISIPLDTLAFQPPTQEFMLAGSSMLTLHFIDNQHLLLTFEVHTLLKRIPGDPPTDQDRNVRALLLELPAGRVLARTEWRLHDRGQYLWNLGHGHFLLRVRDTLTTLAPLTNLATGDAFHQVPFVHVVDRQIGAILLTPESDILTIETKARSSATSDPLAAPDPDPVQVNFYRVAIPDTPTGEVHAIYAGAGRTNKFGNFIITGAGYLEVLDQGHQHWAFNFDTFTGQTWELAAFDSTCKPTPVFVSSSEFVAFACHNTPTPQILGGFNMRGDQMWQQGVFGDYLAPNFVFSPTSGRFAFGRIITTTPVADPTESLVPAQVSSESVVVYQAESGRQILKLDCTPVEVSGENYALSPDGLSFAIIRNGAVEIYKLPALNRKEQSDLKLAEAAAPRPTDLPVHLVAASAPTAASRDKESAPATPAQPTPAQPSQTQAQTQPKATSSSQPPPAAAPTAASSQQQSQPQPATEGDQEPGHRKRPTLYTLPTDPQNEDNAK